MCKTVKDGDGNTWISDYCTDPKCGMKKKYKKRPSTKRQGGRFPDSFGGGAGGTGGAPSAGGSSKDKSKRQGGRYQSPLGTPSKK